MAEPTGYPLPTDYLAEAREHLAAADRHAVGTLAQTQQDGSTKMIFTTHDAEQIPVRVMAAQAAATIDIAESLRELAKAAGALPMVLGGLK